MSGDTALIIRLRGETAADTGDGLTFELSGRGAEEEPAPVVYVDGEAAGEDEYVFAHGDAETAATITFVESRAGCEVKCDYARRLECGPRHDLSVYEVERELNAKMTKDVNGRVMVAESYTKATGWRGMLVWECAEQSFWDEIRRIAETVGTTFDVVRTSLAPPLDRIENLYVTGYPAFREIPGMPGWSRVALSVAQLER